MLFIKEWMRLTWVKSEDVKCCLSDTTKLTFFLKIKKRKKKKKRYFSLGKYEQLLAWKQHMIEVVYVSKIGKIIKRKEDILVTILKKFRYSESNSVLTDWLRAFSNEY